MTVGLSLGHQVDSTA